MIFRTSNFELRTLRLMADGWLLIALLLIGGAPAHAQIPHLIRYQGQVADSQGVPLEGPYTLTFRLYDAETAGTKIWEETQPNVPLQGGHFSVLLGQVTPLSPVDWTNPLWLSVQVITNPQNPDPELAPRQRITSVPLAIRAEDADSLSGHPSAFYLNRASHTGTQPPASLSPQGSGSGLDADSVDGRHAGDLLNRANHTGTQPASTITGTFSPPTISPQGAGSGLDADTVDGLHANQIQSAAAVCAVASEGETITANCPSGKIFRVISAYYVCTQSGGCPDPEIGAVGGMSCSSALNCIGNSSCSFGVGNGQCGGDPCQGTRKRLFLLGLCL